MKKIALYFIIVLILLPFSLKGQTEFSAPKSKVTRINYFSVGYNVQTIPQDAHFIQWLKDSIGYQRPITPTQPSCKIQFFGGEKVIWGGAMYFAPLRWGYGASVGYQLPVRKYILFVFQNHVFRNASFIKPPAYYKVLYPDVRNAKSIRSLSLDIQPNVHIIFKIPDSWTIGLEMGITQSIFKSNWRYGFTKLELKTSSRSIIGIPITEFLGIDVPQIPKTGYFGYFIGFHLLKLFRI